MDSCQHAQKMNNYFVDPSHYIFLRQECHHPVIFFTGDSRTKGFKAPKSIHLFKTESHYVLLSNWGMNLLFGCLGQKNGVAVCLSIGQWGFWRLFGGMFGLERDLFKSKPRQVLEYVQSSNLAPIYEPSRKVVLTMGRLNIVRLETVYSCQTAGVLVRHGSMQMYRFTEYGILIRKVQIENSI